MAVRLRLANDEMKALRALREWRCLTCYTRHEGPPSEGQAWRWCPHCFGPSRRTSAVVIAPEEAEFLDGMLKQMAEAITQEISEKESRPPT